MYILLDACSNPGFLRALYFVLLCMDVIFTIVPIGLIVMLLIDFSKAMVAGASDEAKKSTKLVGQRIISAIILFAIPWIVDVFMSSMEQIGFATDFTTCVTRARSGNFEQYDKLYGEEQKKLHDEWKAKLDAGVAEHAKKIEEQKSMENSFSSTKQMTGTATNNNYNSGKGKTINNEPSDPLTPISNMYKKKGSESYKPSNFVAMKDKNNGYSLGAWPKDANVSNLSGNVKTYQNGILIYPTTGNGYSSYNHNGIDIVNVKIGVPIYAPADGTMSYSEWGHTLNNGSSETAYSVSIKLKKPFKYNGQWCTDCACSSYSTKTDEVATIFMTHMIGIKNRAGSRSNLGTIEVKQGELIGFMGVANNVAHLHMTLYNSNGSLGLRTTEIKKIYNLTSATTKSAGQ